MTASRWTLTGMAAGLIGGLIGLGGLIAAPAAMARGERTIRCESNNGKFNRCNVPWREVELVKQESKGACIRGQGWGVDRQGLWVDRGCRGLFAEARRGGPDHGRPDAGRPGYRPGPGWDRSIRLQCDSNKTRYQMCMVDVGRHGRVELVKRMSDARCTQGHSWGWNRAGVWVDHGCRAQFVVDRRW
ncbi:MAG TPA: DUF3011 domain-containing protein [Rhodanobacter sp.]|nr:DUF3011 domain-containing protein [Rhodanobacter sp.]